MGPPEAAGRIRTAVKIFDHRKTEMKEKTSSRDKVLALLESEKGEYISGEDIASILGISRTAVWKAVNNLKKDGYMIDSVTNRGYCLSHGSDILSEGSLRGYLNDCPPLELDVFDTVDSTNTVCLKRASSGDRSTYAAVAGGQTRGRGRRGRSFFSPDGTGLYMSILLRPSGLSADQAVRFTTVAAVAVSEAIEAVSGRSASIKWVNDIYVGGRKACGILTEASFNPEDGTLDYAVVGIGINVYEPQGGFPEEIRDRAGALAGPVNTPDQEDSGTTGNKVLENGGRNRLAAEILSRFFSYLDDRLVPAASSETDPVPRYAYEYRRRCFVIGMDVDVLKAGSEPRGAHVLGVDDECRLEVRYPDGTEEALSSGEISIRL